MNLNQSKFFGYATGLLISDNIGIQFCNTKSVSCSKIQCAGFFRNDKIKIATQNDDWFLVFIHEFCHYLQQKEQYHISKKIDEYPISLDDWMNDKVKATPSQVKTICRLHQLEELDCEKRVVKFIKKMKLQIDIDYYIKASNAYIWSYTFIPSMKKFFFKFAPSNTPEIIEIMPNKFLRKYGYNAEYKNLILTYCC